MLKCYHMSEEDEDGGSRFLTLEEFRAAARGEEPHESLVLTTSYPSSVPLVFSGVTASDKSKTTNIYEKMMCEDDEREDQGQEQEQDQDHQGEERDGEKGHGKSKKGKKKGKKVPPRQRSKSMTAFFASECSTK